MFLRFNQILFASVVFSLKIGFLMAFIYSLIFSGGILVFSARNFEFSIIAGVSFYVFLVTFLSAWVSFSVSLFLRSTLKPKTEKIEGYYVVGFAAIIANLTVIMGSLSVTLYPFYLLNFLASLIGVFVGGQLYVSTFQKLKIVMRRTS